MRMNFEPKTRRPGMLALASGVVAAFLAAGTASAQRYIQHNLVSDVPGLAAFTDSNLVNAWGIASSPSGPIWVANNGTGTSTVYEGNGKARPLVVTIPPAPANTEGANPTGLVFNGTGQFAISENGASGPALFIFVSEDGTISGWNPSVNPTAAVVALDNSAAGAVYKGAALGSTGAGNFLYATNFHAGVVEVYDSSFNFSFSFTDSSLPAGFAPFGIANIGGRLFVSFALQDGDQHDDVPGPGNGYVDVFDTSGNLLQQFAAQGTLNSPWGMTKAPANFGKFSGAILVGNFGDGRISAFDAATGAVLGQFLKPDSSPFVIQGLWGLHFGNGGSGGRTDNLYFTAGPGDEGHGLFGRIQAIPGVAQMKGRR